VTNLDPSFFPQAPAPAAVRPPGPYIVDITIRLASGGAIVFAGRDLDRAGVGELFQIIQRAVDDLPT
jgi:hypothetical protein